ncbi:MAG: FKBP-type peptidyl-prolyl cis-trans isomerase [Gammaproteobacteria bacterium]|nr:FKBP-type peptidyl-prolyl cis-trans isomerase [Gammaproteobacteria bacterium]MDH5594149.1 FKBP-type peptidyl-prolyl cis-trans isomerase [Gammaproteobacteria bacterium]
MTEEKRIQPDSEVVMYFTLKLEDGTIADSTEDEEPMQFTMGDGSMIPGLERSLYGLQTGEKQSVRIGPDDAFGQRDPENIRAMKREEFPADMALEPGVVIEFDTPTGESIAGMITEVQTDTVNVDFNHPLAGHEVTFDVEIVDINPS